MAERVVKHNRKNSDELKAQMESDLAKMRPGAAVVPNGAPPERPVLQRFRGKLCVRGELHNDWEVEIPAEHSIQDALDPIYWKDHVGRLIGTGQVTRRGGRGDIVHVWKPDTGQYCKLLIVEIGPGFMRTMVVESASSEVVELPADSPYYTRWNVGRGGHEILRKADNYVINPGPYQTVAAAAAWIGRDMAARNQPPAA